MTTSQAVKPGAVKAWILAARPQVLTAGVLPIAAGSALAYKLHHHFELYIFVCALLSAICIQVGSHFVNDAIDYIRGTDTQRRVGFKRAVQQGWISAQQMFRAAYIMLGLSVLFALPVAFQYPEVIAIVFVCALMGYFYTGGPFPLSYLGLGDLFVILFYGFVITGTIYYTQAGTIDMPVLLLSLQIGILATTIIAINNFRDREEDAKSGKKTLAVRWGPLFSRWEITATLLLPFALNLVWLAWGYPLPGLLPLAALPVALLVIRQIWKTEPSKVYNTIFIQASMVHTLFCLLFIIACLW